MSAPAPLARSVMAQARVEARLTLRRGENLLAIVGLPVAALGLFGTLGLVGGHDLGSLVPGVLALALVASGLVNLGIATGFERGYGVLKRLGGSPLGRDGLIAAKVTVVGAIAFAQVGALLALAVAIGWRPGPSASIAGLILAVIVGSATFASLGLLIAGSLRAEATLVVANVVFLVALLLGGVLLPIDDLPGPLQAVASASPVGALAEAFRSALTDGGGYLEHLAVVAVWGLAATALTVRTFRWD
ncbi:MAG TPA: ABC transporter permease [Candidatus Limnocylindrales bacterium]